MGQNASSNLKVKVLYGKIAESTMDINTKFGKLKRKFCKKNRIRNSAMKFLFDGQIIHDQDTAASIGFMDGDTVEVFKEMFGGGKPMGKNIAKDSVKILSVLDTFSASEDDENDDDMVETEHDIQSDVGTDKSVNQVEETITDNQSYEMIEACYQIQIDETLQHHPKQNDDATLTQNYSLANEFQPDILNISRYAAENEELEIGENIEQARQLGRIKGPFQTQVQCQNENLRQSENVDAHDQRKILNDEANNIYTKIKLSEEKKEETLKSKCEGSLDTSESPKHLENIKAVFGISTPSPLMKMAKIKDEEMRRLSLAIHLWAEIKCGSMKILKQTRLTEKHFKEIIAFAGPHTKYKFIKDRSALQYKNLWRNSNNSSDLYRGHPATGYETEMKLHDPSILYCPFEHCSIQLGPMRPLDIDLMMLTPKKRKYGNSTFRKTF